VESKEHKDLEQDKDLEQTTDILCDVCHGVHSTEPCCPVSKGKGSKHHGEQYELHLCEACFFATLATLKESIG
jgi:hypothetical protein